MKLEKHVGETRGFWVGALFTVIKRRRMGSSQYVIMDVSR